MPPRSSAPRGGRLFLLLVVGIPFFSFLLSRTSIRLALRKWSFSAPGRPSARGCEEAAAVREYAATEALWGTGDFLIDTDGKADYMSYSGVPGGYLKSLASKLGQDKQLSVINVGANKGQLAQHLLSLFPHAHVHSFEAFPATFELLKAVRERAPAAVKSAWSLYSFVVSDADGPATVFGSAGHESTHTGSARGSFFPDTFEAVDVKAITLSTWLKSSDAPHSVDLLHVDAEGHDLAILAGLEWREHLIPLVVFETSPMYLMRENNPKGYTLETTLNEAAGLGYECFFLGFRDLYRISPQFARPGSYIYTDLHSASRFTTVNSGANVLCALTTSPYYKVLTETHTARLSHCPIV